VIDSDMQNESVVGRFQLPTRLALSGVARRLSRAGYLAGSPSHSRYRCVFVETQDGRLAKEGYRLSVRTTGSASVWHLAGPEADSETPYGGDTAFRSLPSDAPGIPTIARVLAGSRLLLPLIRLRVFAQEVEIAGPSASRFSLRVERFLAASPWEDWPKGPWPHALFVVRLLEGHPDAFLHLTTYLRDRLGLPVSPGDACRTALRTRGLPEPGAPTPPHLVIRPVDPLVTAARKVVAQQALKMRANIQGALEDLDPEFLHDLRVATRRLRSALRLFADVLGPKRCDALRGELGLVGQVLGAVRDLDVFGINLQAQAQRLAEARGIAGRLAEELARQRGPARSSLVAALTARRFTSLVRRLDALAAAPPPRRPRGAQGVPVAVAAPALIRRAQRRVLRLGRAIGPESPAADLHRLRILFKRLRYACEFFQEAFADPATGSNPLADYVQAMIRFQDCLGEHQDAMTAMVRIQGLAREAVQSGTLLPEQLLDLGSLVQVQREIARTRRTRLAKLWSRFDRPSVRRRLAALEAAVQPRPGADGASEMSPA
jgi:CHAD domain-containing protein